MPLPINRPPTETYRPRFTLTWRAKNDSGVWCDWIAWLPTLIEARAYVHDIVHVPVKIFDRYVDQTGSLFPSGALRWDRGTRR